MIGPQRNVERPISATAQVTIHSSWNLGTMAVATRVISDPAVAAVFTTLDMAAEGGRTALLDGRHHLELIEAHMPGIGLAPSGAMVMKDVRDLQPRAAHRRRTNPPVLVPRRMGVRGGRAG